MLRCDRRDAATLQRRAAPARGFEPLEGRRLLTADPLPFVKSISLVDAAASATSRSWNVTFSESVTGVDVADFKLALSGVKASAPLTLTGSGAVYKLTAADVAGSGTIGLNLVDDGSIHDLTGNPLGSPNAVSFAAPAPALQAGSGPISVAVSDFNGDGKTDLVAANYFGNSVSVLLGKGDGTFQPNKTFSCGSFPYSVAVGDFNGDGKADLATANYFGNSASILLGKGDGTFGQQQEFATGSRPVSVAVGFFDGDTKADLAVTNNDDATLGILLGKGDGTFGQQQTFATGRSPASGVVADFNGDTKSDIATANYGTNTVSVMLGKGDGTLQPQQMYAANKTPWAVSVGDVNGDTHADIVTANTGSGTLIVLLGYGNGYFLPQQQAFATGTNPYAVVIGDANADGRADLLVTNSDSNTLGVLLGNGDGTFQTQREFATGRTPRAVAFADFNGDRKPDVVTANFAGNTISVLLGNLSGSFTGAVAAVDTVAPTLAIAASRAALKAGQTATITFTLSEESSTFGLGDVKTAGGTLSAFTGSGKSYRATFTPAADSTAAGTISVDAGVFTDRAGNVNLAASLSPTLRIDTILPTVAITSAAPSLRPGQSTTITFTLSKPSTNFSLAAVTATGGSLSSFKAVSNTVYTVAFTAGARTTAKGRIVVAAGRFTDVAGNGNVAASLVNPINIVPQP